MPIITPETVQTKGSDGVGDPCGPYSAQLFSESGGLTQFGAFVEILPPGSRSSIKHWHEGEDEMVFMLEGEVTLHEGDTQTLLHPGKAATFKAGAPVGHCIENTSNAPARYLVIGTSSDGDVITYPDDDRILRWSRDKDGNHTRIWTDLAGQPAPSAYTPANNNP